MKQRAGMPAHPGRLFWAGRMFWLVIVSAALCVRPLGAQQPGDSVSARADTVKSAESQVTAKKKVMKPIVPADTIPDDFFQIVDNLGVHRYTKRLLGHSQALDDSLILESLARANEQVDYLRSSAYAVIQAIRLLCDQDSVWKNFFADLDMQLKENDILRFNFKDNQKWKSYALNELFYSAFFQELLLIMGNIGIVDSKDGKQWLRGWPDELRWKYREYQFEYMPEEKEVKIMDLRGGPNEEQAARPSLRTQPTRKILPTPDSVELPYNTP